MQIFDQDMEEKCIKTLTSNAVPDTVRSKLLGQLSKEFFHYPPCKAAFARIDIIAKKRFSLTDHEELLSDPALSEDFRDMLRESAVEHASSKKRISNMVELLDKWRKIRIVYDMANDALEHVESDNVDIDEVLLKITTKLTSAQRNVGEDDAFVHIGLHNNADELAEEAINSTVEELIKTGFNDYDSRNGGIPKEGVMIIGATTSGGKSTVLMNLLVNLYLLANQKVARISLEMGDRQEMQRLLSRLSAVPFWKIKQKKCSPKEKLRIREAYANFKKHGLENGSTFSSLSPKRNMTIDDVLRVVKPFGFNVVALDYISLLDGVDEDNQWRVLSAIIRKCKVFSREAKCLVIVLCQIDSETSKIRYSQGMKEHADVVWLWNYFKKEQRELKIIPVDVAKARDGELMTFNLGERFDIMTVENMQGNSDFSDSSSSDEDEEDIPKKKKKSDSDDGTKKKKKKKSSDSEKSSESDDDYNEALVLS